MYALIFFSGTALLLAGGLLLVVEAFRERILWGLGCLLVPPVSLLFTVLYWNVAKKPFFIQLLGLVLVVVASLVAPA